MRQKTLKKQLEAVGNRLAKAYGNNPYADTPRVRNAQKTWDRLWEQWVKAGYEARDLFSRK